MYVTRRLSQLQQSPETLSAPPDGPNSGYLLIQDQESERTTCFGLCKKRNLSELPFPQNKELSIQFVVHAGHATYAQIEEVFLIPALDQPLSSNRYYVVAAHRKHIGEALTSSREEDKVTCCFCRHVKDVKSRPLDPRDVYQQFDIVPNDDTCGGKGSFYANSVAPDGFPPNILRQKGWMIYTKTAENCKLDTAEGVNSKIRSELPEFDFSLSRKSSESSVVGKWYCPFVFVKEGTLREQMKKSMYYEVTLEQRWEQIFTCHRNPHSNSVAINAIIEKEEAFIDGIKTIWNESDGVMWFSSLGGEQKSVGLRMEVVRRMRWEEERFGYASGKEKQVKIDTVEKYKGYGEWSEFGCYILVERFNLKTMDGSMVMCYDFKHSDKMNSKWQ